MEARKVHYPVLDGLRGIAALLVVLHHVATASKDITHPQKLAALVTKMLTYWGHPAVLLFFVLSGFVLQSNYGRSAQSNYLGYVSRRFMRIFPALIASLILAAVLVRPEAGEIYGPWVSGLASGDHSSTSWFRHAALFVITPDDLAFNPVLWSLAYEWRVSLIFPLLAALVLGYPRIMAASALPLYVTAKLALIQLGMHAPYLDGSSFVGAVLITLFYVPAFLMGMVLAVWVLRMGEPSFAIPLWLESAWLIAVAAPYFFIKEDFALALGAALMVGLLVCGGRTGKLLTLPPLLWVGKVSYSLYLMHFPLMLFFLSFYPSIPLWLAVALTIAFSLGVAEIGYRFIERPAGRLGKRLKWQFPRSLILRN